jgi:hypothetical protein
MEVLVHRVQLVIQVLAALPVLLVILAQLDLLAHPVMQVQLVMPVPPEIQVQPAPLALRVSAAQPATPDPLPSALGSLTAPDPLVPLVQPEVQVQPETPTLPVIHANEELPDQQVTPAQPHRKAQRATRVSKARPVHRAQRVIRIQPDQLVQPDVPAPLLQLGRKLPYRDQ